ncbi:MAG: PDDEXK nuclease domain-containing protein [Candidatus Kapaibacteriota bacterium]
MQHHDQFADILSLIREARTHAFKAVNAELIRLYWSVGAYIHFRVEHSQWGEKTVDELAAYIQTTVPELKGFNRRGLYRMKQFFETYYVQSSVPLELSIKSFSSMRTIVSSVMTQFENGDVRQSILAKVSWTHHLTLMARTKSAEERDFYLQIALQERYSVRELDRQISAGLFERTMLGNQHISPTLRETHPSIINTFKDHYVFEFLNLPEPYSERELQKALLRQMKHFILELGQDFLFYAEECKVQVGKSDFFLDLLFYHRGLQCLVAFELKNRCFSTGTPGQTQLLFGSIRPRREKIIRKAEYRHFALQRQRQRSCGICFEP